MCMSVVVSVCGDSARTIYHDAGGRGVEGNDRGDVSSLCFFQQEPVILCIHTHNNTTPWAKSWKVGRADGS